MYTICFCIYTLFKKIQHSKSVWFSHCISHNISQPANRLSKYQNSFFPSTIKTWNTLDLNIREVPTFFTFKKRLQFKYFRNKKIPCYFSSGDRYLNVLQSRLRNRCSALNSDLYRANLIPNALCSCGKSDETAEHFFITL